MSVQNHKVGKLRCINNKPILVIFPFSIHFALTLFHDLVDS